MTTQQRDSLPLSCYGLPERHEYPMPDAAHVRAAESYFRYCPPELRHKLAQAIMQKAAEFGVTVHSPEILAAAGPAGKGNL